MNLKRIETFAANGTFTKQAGDVLYDIQLIGGGASGQAGARQAPGVAAPGGAGGAPGAFVRVLIPASQLPSSSYSVTIGAGGTGPNAPADNSNGVAQAAGGNTSLGPFIAYGGGSGTAATTTAGGASYAQQYSSPYLAIRGGAGGLNGAGLSATNEDSQTNYHGYPTAGGGGAAGISAANVAYAGSMGQQPSYYNYSYRPAPGTGGAVDNNGGNGKDPSDFTQCIGGGGGGGAGASLSGAAPNGGNGGRGAGGGGGPGTRNGQTGGNAGNGGDGYVVVFVYG